MTAFATSTMGPTMLSHEEDCSDYEQAQGYLAILNHLSYRQPGVYFQKKALRHSAPGCLQAIVADLIGMCMQTHPWKLVDAASNSVIEEFTATGLDQVVSVGEALPEILAEREAEREGKHSDPLVASRPHPSGQPRTFAGFDGIGGSDQQYASAQVGAIIHHQDAIEHS